MMISYVLIRPFNRTIVELKLPSNPKSNAGTFTFNRTIVELKLCQRLQIIFIKPLLIEPLWNWNYKLTNGDATSKTF